MHQLLHAVFRLSGEWPCAQRAKVGFAELEQAAGQLEGKHFAADHPQFADEEQLHARRLPNRAGAGARPLTRV